MAKRSMSRMFEEKRKSPRVQFEKPLDARLMAIDGTWYRDCQLLDLSESGARIRIEGSAAELIEFFLLLTRFGAPVHRRCKRAWVNGSTIGVSFEGGQQYPSRSLTYEAALAQPKCYGRDRHS